MDPLGEILKALTSTTMNAWGCLAILFVCAAWAYGQYLRHVYHKEERAARVPGDSGQAVPPVKPPGSNGLLLILLAMFGLGLGGIILRSGLALERPGGVAGAPPGCSPATCKPPAKCTPEGCADIASPRSETPGLPAWSGGWGPMDDRAPGLRGGS